MKTVYLDFFFSLIVFGYMVSLPEFARFTALSCYVPTLMEHTALFASSS